MPVFLSVLQTLRTWTHSRAALQLEIMALEATPASIEGGLFENPSLRVTRECDACHLSELGRRGPVRPSALKRVQSGNRH